MVNWIVILIIGAAAFFFFKFSNLRYERIWTYSIAIILIFLLFTFFSVISHNKVDISSFDGFVSGTKVYGNWLFGWAKNAAKVTGNVVNIDWSVNSSSDSSKNKK